MPPPIFVNTVNPTPVNNPNPPANADHGRMYPVNDDDDKECCSYICFLNGFLAFFLLVIFGTIAGVAYLLLKYGWVGLIETITNPNVQVELM